jgi:hypothetical protein
MLWRESATFTIGLLCKKQLVNMPNEVAYGKKDKSKDQKLLHN